MRARGKLITLVALGIGLALLVATLVSSLDSFESQEFPMDRDARWTMHGISIVAILATLAAAILSFRRWVLDLEGEIKERRENENRLKEAYGGSALSGEGRNTQSAHSVESAPVEKPQAPVAAQHFSEEPECPEAALQGNNAPCFQRQKRIINAREIIDDVRSGMSDAELMEKYRLSSMGLQSAFSKLLNSRLLTVDEIYGQPHRDDENNTVIIDDPRKVPSRFLTISVPLYEESREEMRGRLRDITEKGMNITGIDARLGEVKQFVIPCQDYLDVSSIHFEAECRWLLPKKDEAFSLAGFQITQISRKDLTELRRLIGCLTFS